MLAPQRHGSNKTQALLAARNPGMFGPFPPVLRSHFKELEGPLGDELLAVMVDNGNLSPRPLYGDADDKMTVSDVQAVMEENALPATTLGIMSAMCRLGAIHASRPDAKIVCKSPDNLQFFDEINRTIQDAGFIHVIRDPRAVWNSGRGTPRGPQSPHAAAAAWKKYHERVLTLSAQVSLQTIRFEDLLQDPSSELQRACSFLDVPFEPVMLDAHDSADARAASRANSQLWGNLDKPVQPDRASAWQRELPEREVEIVERTCRDLMDQFGYECVHPRHSLTDDDISFLPKIARQSAVRDPREHQIKHLRSVYEAHNLSF
ncbi:MAG: sulfotransferase [Planctomycetota bacterium]|nr:sulfotransferase [Planctomycetota bacterium]